MEVKSYLGFWSSDSWPKDPQLQFLHFVLSMCIQKKKIMSKKMNVFGSISLPPKNQKLNPVE